MQVQVENQVKVAHSSGSEESDSISDKGDNILVVERCFYLFFH
jgi:hypothetical protein